jgi:signal transduction histidine kinase
MDANRVSTNGPPRSRGGLEAEKQAQDRLDQIILGIAHELNNPNAFVRVNATNLKKMFWLLRPCLDEYERNHPDALVGPFPLAEFRARFNQHLEGILEASVRIIGIADKLKRCTSETLARRSTVSLAETVADMIRAHDFLLGNCAEVDFHVEGDRPCRVLGYRLELEQAVSILITNAIDAIRDRYQEEEGDKGHLLLSLEEEGDQVVLRVADNGTGMDRDTMDKVFIPYFTTKPQGQGDGLGLPLCSSIVGRHGGRIDIESEEGKGTEVTIKLPKQEG